ncbi:hypothetical protein [Sinorhizobium meliloti]|nr:hypothetical protein U8C39_09620 [Sinorhizobium meliloti]WQP31714.1 hypothetical protein U8C45_09585 [Sinorhizobium meliloti]
MTRNDKQSRKETRETQGPALIAWHVTEKGEKKAFWTRIGAAWHHQKGDGLTLQLDLVPVTGGRIVLLPPKEDRNEGAGA